MLRGTHKDLSRPFLPRPTLDSWHLHTLQSLFHQFTLTQPTNHCAISKLSPRHLNKPQIQKKKATTNRTDVRCDSHSKKKPEKITANAEMYSLHPPNPIYSMHILPSKLNTACSLSGKITLKRLALSYHCLILGISLSNHAQASKCAGLCWGLSRRVFHWSSRVTCFCLIAEPKPL